METLAVKRSPLVNKHYLFIALLLFIIVVPAPRSLAKTKSSPLSFSEVTVLLAVDGLSANAFAKGRELGLFQAFDHVSTHIAPFPSMTDLTWSTLTNTAEIFGAPGRIRSVEATYFDESTRSVQGDPRDYYRRLAFPKYYMNAFQFFFNPYVEGLMYFPTKEMAKVEINHVVEDILKSKEPLITAYIGGIDSTAHTQKERLFPVLRELDRGINHLLSEFAHRNQSVELILVSDHGNIGRFREGTQEEELLAVDIKKIINEAGFRSVQKLSEANDVAIPLLALGSWAPVYLQERKKIASLVSVLDQQPWFELAVSLERHEPQETTINVFATKGQRAQVIYKRADDVFYYVALSGNPLQIPEKAISHNELRVPITRDQAFQLTLKTDFPDSLQRLLESTSQKNFDFPDLIITLKDGYFIQNSLSQFTKMYRTHGSLSANSSFGILASTKSTLPQYIRTHEILPALKISSQRLFGPWATKIQIASSTTQNPSGIVTQARDFSEKRIFQLMSRFIGDSRAYFVISEFEEFLKAFNLDPLQPPTKQNLLPNQFKWKDVEVKSLLSAEDIGALTDVVLTHQKAPIEALKTDPRVQRLQTKLGIPSTAQPIKATRNKSQTSSAKINAEMAVNYSLTSKRAAMKMYQIPYLLDRALSLPEKAIIPETRDLPFAQYWRENRTGFTGGTYSLNAPRAEGTVATSLFAESFKEEKLQEQIFPAPLNKFYGKALDEITLVYIPGIYNSLFDQEIFSLGLMALREDLGLRVITPPVESICAADFNADIILQTLQKDFKQRVERGFKEPHYLILGYSKGAVDTLHAIAKDPAFFSNHVRGLVSIASPLQGSEILNKTDLPFAIVDLLSEHRGPEICRNEKPSGPSISPSAMASFWRRSLRSLIGITRYFSISFVSRPEDSHLFMKATKIIAQFEEDNDGVVTRSASQFPPELGAIDFGIVQADHLSGILASRFDQKAFLRAIINTLSELDVDDSTKNLIYNANQIIAQADKITGSRPYGLKVNPSSVQLQPTLSNIKGFVNYYSKNQFFKTRSEETNYSVIESSFQLNQRLIPASVDPANFYQTRVMLPPNEYNYEPYRSLDVQKLSSIFAKTKVAPSTPENTPTGILIDFNHSNMVHFRMDHQFNYESRSPLGLDDNETFGYKPTMFNGDSFLMMKSKNNSIRMTSIAYRFKPSDFPSMNLRLAVQKGVNGADPVLGGTGVDDSAFQVWFTVRYGGSGRESIDERTTVDPQDNDVFLFGYYWGDPAPNGQERKPQEIFENWYSKKNVIVATLPEAKQLLLNDQSQRGQVIDYKQDLFRDLQRAFPDRDPNKMEILAITLQHDSNDAEDSSEAYFKHLRFLPEPHLTDHH